MKKTLLIAASALLASAAWSQMSCDNRMPITEAYTETGIIEGEPTTVNCSGLGGAANWFSFTPSETDVLLLTSSFEYNGGWDSNVHVYSGECGALVCETSDDDGGSVYLSTLVYEFQAGVDYTIVWDNLWSSDSGTFYLGSPDDVEGLLNPDGSGGANPALIEFVDSTEAPFGANCIVDMNGDYLDDIVSANTQEISVAYQQPDGSFVSQSIDIIGDVSYGPDWSIHAGDYDNNGYNDIVFGGGSGVSILMRSDDGTSVQEFSTSDYVFSQRGNSVDINNDGILDVFMCHDVDANVYYISDGEGGFTFIQGGLGDTAGGGNYGSIWVDYNNDCLIDLFIAKCRGGDSPANINQMHRNNGDGTFTEVGEEIGLADNLQTWSSAWADFDNDGDMDVFVGASSNEHGPHKMMRNDDGIFTDVTAELGFDVTMIAQGIQHTAHDFNNDGFVDIKLTGNGFLLNNGDMTFEVSSSTASDGAVGDLNNDGYLDIARGFDVKINQGSGNNYLKVNTIGTTSNKNGIGSRITIQTADGIQIRDVKAGDAFSTMSSITTHFGLGQQTVIDQMTICWPSGNETVIEDVAANSTINVVEIDGTVESVNDIVNESLSVFPNPTSDWLQLEADLNLNGVAVTVVGLDGKEVIKSYLHDNRIDVSSLATGVYFLHMQVNGAIIKTQFVKE